MKVSEIIELAKAGYKPSDIIAAQKLINEEPDEEPMEEPMEEPDEEPMEEPDEEPMEEPEPVHKEDPDDYKKKYEDLKKKLEKLQAENINKNIEGNRKTDEDILAETIKGFM